MHSKETYRVATCNLQLSIKLPSSQNEEYNILEGKAKKIFSDFHKQIEELNSKDIEVVLLDTCIGSVRADCEEAPYILVHKEHNIWGKEINSLTFEFYIPDEDNEPYEEREINIESYKDLDYAGIGSNTMLEVGEQQFIEYKEGTPMSEVALMIYIEEEGL